ncbi:unnamed protein product [Withania somnifera]
MRNRKSRKITFLLLLLTLLPISTLDRQLVLVLSQEDLKEAAADSTNLVDDPSDSGFDDFIDSEAKPDYVLDPGSWSPIFESATAPQGHLEHEGAYYSAVSKIVKAYSRGDERKMEEAAASEGHQHVQGVKLSLFLYHHFAAEGGNMQSKMALAYSYSHREMHDKAVKLYAELAEVAINSFLIAKDSHTQVAYSCIQATTLFCLQWLGYLYVKGYGVEKNYTKAKEYFEKAADNGEAGGFYNLGVMYLKGIGVKRDVKIASKYFTTASDAGQPKAFYQLAKMFLTGAGLKKNVPLASSLYKLVAECGPWSSFSKWPLESYLRGDVGRAFLLYSRMAKLGYEIAQSNAAWILDKYGEGSMCLGESGICSDEERHQRSHALWWKASEQGNEHAALLIGDAYCYGRHGQGLPFDLHLAKRYYDQAFEVDHAAKLPVQVIDSLPEVYPKVEAWVEDVLMEEGNATLLTLFVCLLTVLYLRERQRRHVAAAAGEVAFPHQLGEQRVPIVH